MKAWRRLAPRRFKDRVMFFVPTRGKHVRFEQKRDVQLKRAMQLVQAARGKKGGGRDAGEKSH